MNNSVVFKNDLVSLEWNDSRLELHDSDGEYLDYFLNAGDFDDDEEKDYIEEIVSVLSAATEERLCNVLKSSFEFRDIIHNCDDAMIKDLREQYGSEWVNRVGSTALIIRE